MIDDAPGRAAPQSSRLPENLPEGQPHHPAEQDPSALQGTADLRERFGRIEERTEHLQGDIAQLRGEMGELRGEVGELRKEMGDIRSTMATRKEMDDIRSTMATRADIAQLRDEIGELRTATSTDIAQLRDEMGGLRKEMGELRTATSTDIAQLRSEMQGMVGQTAFWSGIAIVVAVLLGFGTLVYNKIPDQFPPPPAQPSLESGHTPAHPPAA